MGAYGGPDIITDGLKLILDAASARSYSGTGTTWNDLSGEENNSTLVNGPVFNSSGYFDLDGSDDYVNVPSALRSLFSSGPNCFDIWLYKPASSTNQQVVFDIDSTRWNINFNLYASGKWTFDFYDGTEHIITANDNYDDSWVNFTAQQLSDNTIQFYANAILIGSQSANALAPNGNVIRLGSATPGNKFFNGNIAEVKIYNRSLTQAEITQNYNALKNRFI